MAKRSVFLAVLCASAALACDEPKKDQPAPTGQSTQAVQQAAKYDRVPRLDFNRIAAELALPIFWVADKNNDNALSPDELATYWGLKTPVPAFAEGYEKIAA